MTDEPATFAPSPQDGSGFRALIGLSCLAGSLCGFGALFFIEIPPRNENALLLALGMVFGWASSVVQSEFGASTTGRKAANAAIDQIGTGPR